MKKVKNFLFPDGDIHCGRAVFNELSKIDSVIKLSKQLNIPLNICVQAGGNVGVFPCALSKWYKKVYTFEPHEENYECLELNIASRNIDNIICSKTALSNEITEVGLFPESNKPNNFGAFQIDEKGKGISTITIDSLKNEISDCNLIYLDIEGYEYKALEGAKDIISEFKPIIIVENKALNGSEIVYNKHIKETIKLIESFGYKQKYRWMRDSVMVPV